MSCDSLVPSSLPVKRPGVDGGELMSATVMVARTDKMSDPRSNYSQSKKNQDEQLGEPRQQEQDRRVDDQPHHEGLPVKVLARRSRPVFVGKSSHPCRGFVAFSGFCHPLSFISQAGVAGVSGANLQAFRLRGITTAPSLSLSR